MKRSIYAYVTYFIKEAMLLGHAANTFLACGRFECFHSMYSMSHLDALHERHNGIKFPMLCAPPRAIGMM